MLYRRSRNPWVLDFMVSLFCYLLLKLSRFLVNKYRFLSEILKKSHVHRPLTRQVHPLALPTDFQLSKSNFPSRSLSYYSVRYFRKIRAFFGCSAYSMKRRHMPQLPVRLLYTGNSPPPRNFSDPSWGAKMVIKMKQNVSAHHLGMPLYFFVLFCFVLFCFFFLFESVPLEFWSCCCSLYNRVFKSECQ